MGAPAIHLDFAASWTAQILAASPLISPARSYIWPFEVAGEQDALARGAMRVMVRPEAAPSFLATCALGFEHPEMPSGVWSCPSPDEICAVAGGYAYIARVDAPERPIHLPMRPAVDVRPVMEHGLLLFVGFHTVMAWGERGIAWESQKLSWEGVRLGAVEGNILHGWGWDMPKDADAPFRLDLRTGERL